MSAIYFHSFRKPAVRVSGAERAMFNSYTDDLFLASLGMHYDPWITKYFPSEHYAIGCDIHTAVTALGSHNLTLTLDGNSYGIFGIKLNTALVMGSDPIKLAARLNGQCELHCYVMPHNKHWMAGIIHDGLASGVYRKDMGWESVITLLESRSQSPVVCSYSVTDRFPHLGSWKKSLEGLEDMGLELTPDNWDSFYFDYNVNGFDFRKDHYESV